MTAPTLPWWWPKRIDDAYLARLRGDYPEDTAGMTDEAVREHYGLAGLRYSAPSLWDGTGDAAAEFEAVADALLAAVETLEWIAEGQCPEPTTGAKVALEKIRGAK